MSRFIRQFSCPQEPYDPLVSDTIAATHAKAAVSAYMEKYPVDSTCALGVSEFLRTFLDSKPDLNSVWDPSFGCAAMALQTPSTNSISTLLMLAMRISTLGIPGQWRIESENPSTLCWGQWMFPGVTKAEVTSDSQAVLLKLGSANKLQTIYLNRLNGEWICEGLVPVPTFGRRKCIGLLSLGETGYIPLSRIPSQERVCDSIPDHVIEKFEQAIMILKDVDDQYQAWVENVLKNIVVLRFNPETSASGSWEDFRGMAYISASPDPIWLAESLVHESAHQYYQIADLVGAVDDGTDLTTYYSPPVKRMRSLDRILVAYHAFGNVLLFYRQGIFRNVFTNDKHLIRESDLTEMVDQLERPLRNNAALTDIGEALFKSLHENIKMTSR